MIFEKAFKKTLAATLSISTLLCGAANVTEAYGFSGKENIPSKNRTIAKIAKVGAEVALPAALLAGAGATLLIYYLLHNNNFEQIPVKGIDIENMTASQVQNYLDSQIKMLESKGIIIDDNVKKEANPKFLALVIKGFNEIIRQYPNLVKRMKDNDSKEFRIGFIDEEDGNYKENNPPSKAPHYNEGAWRDLWGKGIMFKKSLLCGSLTDFCKFTKENEKKQPHMAVDPTMLVEAFVAREVGLFIVHHCKLGDVDILGEVFKLAHSKNPKLTDQDMWNVSKQDNNVHAFAELFAYSMYGKVQNEFTFAMRQYLNKKL